MRKQFHHIKGEREEGKREKKFFFGIGCPKLRKVMVLVLFSPPPIFFEEDVSRVAVVRVKKVGGGPLAAVAQQLLNGLRSLATTNGLLNLLVT